MKTPVQLGRVGLLALASGLFLAGCGQNKDPENAQQGSQERPPHSVEVVELARQDVDIERSYPSLLRSDDEVKLVARVAGTLQQRHFEAGQMVEKGELLYSIEPDVYQAIVNQREADLESARAQLFRAQRDADRFERLLGQNSVSRQDYDKALADARVAQASVAQAEASLASARIDLDYAKVKAPVSGMISLSQINVGNFVSTGTELATITPLDPLEVRFQLPQSHAFELRRQLKGQDIESITTRLQVPGSSGDETGSLNGNLDFLGSRVDQATSTVQANATFPNPDASVLPGQFVRIRIEGLKRYGVLAVPEIAVGQGLMGPQIFVLDENNVARARPVDLGEVAGPWQILQGGVEPGERVVVGDLAGVQPGTTIEPQPFKGDADSLVEDAEASKEEARHRDMEKVTEAEPGTATESAEDASS